MSSERFEIPANGAVLAAERWAGQGAPVVLLHAGVADRRVWEGVALLLDAPAIAYDRRGFGDTPPSDAEFTHLDDLAAVLDRVADEPAWLVGNSMGGALAIDAALTFPERLAGLVLIAPAVSGQPEPELEDLDPDSERIIRALIEAMEAGDVDAQLRQHAHLWLDGPAQPELRVGGAARTLALAMNEVIVRHALPEDFGEADVDAWSRLEEIDLPVTVVWGDLDVPSGIESAQTIADRIPGARSQVLHGLAHLPSLEDPVAVTRAIREAMA
ncbi:MAG: alpha/beta hydrolase [Solirubrobacteraceae bacterium]|nr:alpha/beta hydrolase [Solirubrobacteraceae bacterium]